MYRSLPPLPADPANPNPAVPQPRGELSARVRYVECDPMGVAHHSAYPIWLEMARTEMLRAQGMSYRDCEASGVYFVVARLNMRYRKPAHYDDELVVRVTLAQAGKAKLEHVYEVYRGEDLVLTADSTLVCVDAQGRLRPVPDELLPRV